MLKTTPLFAIVFWTDGGKTVKGVTFPHIEVEGIFSRPKPRSTPSGKESFISYIHKTIPNKKTTVLSVTTT